MEPVRTCVGCRGTDSRSVLLRVVVGPSQEGDPQRAVLVPDPRRRLPGRGAWLHPNSRCLDLAVRRRAFGRALRVSAAVDLDAVAAYVESDAGGTVHQGTESGFDADEHPMSTQR